MAVTAEDIQEQIILEIGDVDPATGDPPANPATGVIANQIELLWDRFAAADAIAPGLREQYVKRAAIRMVLAVLRPKFFDMADTVAGPNYKLSQVVKGYELMLEQTDEDITVVKAGGTLASRSYQAEQITTTAPYTPSYPPDANWTRRYGGSPYARRHGRRVYPS